MAALRTLAVSISWLPVFACSSSSHAPQAAPAEADSAPPATPLLSVVSGRFPAQEATGVCADTPLRLTFGAAPSVGTAGKIQVWKATDPGAPVDIIDLSAAAFTDTIGGRVFQTTRPVYIDGLDAVVDLHSRVLLPNETYFVTVDTGTFIDASGQPLGGVTDPAAWRFSTGAPAPGSPTDLVVDGKGGGDFCTVQGAIDFVPAMSASPVVITVKAGTYHEIVFISRKNSLTLRGEDRKNSVIAYANNDTLQKGGGTHARAMVEVENVTGFTLENMTLYNTTPQNGSQAEALRVEPGEQVILRDADFISRQDTLLLSGHVYVKNCYVEGNVDFIWGRGTAYFDQCELKTAVRAGYEVQARNSASFYGYIFVDSKLTADPGVTGNMLGRIDVSSFPDSNVAYINCQMGPHIDARGWLVSGAAASTSGLRFWEYQSTDLNGQPLDVSARIAPSRQLTDAEAMMLRDKATVLGGWNPTP